MAASLVFTTLSFLVLSTIAVRLGMTLIAMFKKISEGIAIIVLIAFCIVVYSDPVNTGLLVRKLFFAISGLINSS